MIRLNWLVIFYLILLVIASSPNHIKGHKSSRPRGGWCGSRPTQSFLHEAEAHFESLLHEFESLFHKLVTRDIESGGGKPVRIPLYFHIIQEGPLASQGHVTKLQIQQQIAILNQAFEGSGVQFFLAGSDYTTNSRWFNNIGPSDPDNNDFNSYDMAARKKLQKPGENVLNIYTVSFNNIVFNPKDPRQHLSGFSSFPYRYRSYPELDGILLSYNVLPGSSNAGHSEGKVLVHEVGHWVGLYHTFEGGTKQGGCVGPGDYVADTAPEFSGASGCPTLRKSCYNSLHFDPIHNYMDYSDDSCRHSFTQGQVTRMRQQLHLYRGISFSDPISYKSVSGLQMLKHKTKSKSLILIGVPLGIVGVAKKLGGGRLLGKLESATEKGSGLKEI